ncbi:hypothetical protein [Kitasatospora acidiphila]|uniref:hypothetical protein n=1 Tax=Kitasatospora acidiphila TaxID=2567942 RepID=UPI001E391950|nr:hypothetical protein [Kitasatospora acidiphila]
MTVTLQSPGTTRTRDPRELLNAVQPRIQHLSVNVLDSGMTIWDREVALLLRDEVMVRDLAERILGNAVMYVIASMEHPDVHLGVGKVVDIGVHQVILDTPVYFALCELLPLQLRTTGLGAVLDRGWLRPRGRARGPRSHPGAHRDADRSCCAAMSPLPAGCLAGAA